MSDPTPLEVGDEVAVRGTYARTTSLGNVTVRVGNDEGPLTAVTVLVAPSYVVRPVADDLRETIHELKTRLGDLATASGLSRYSPDEQSGYRRRAAELRRTIEILEELL